MIDPEGPAESERAAPLHSGRRFVVYRALGEDDDRLVVKTPRPHRECDGASLRHEYQMLQRLSAPGVCTALGLREASDPPALLLADAGPADLDRWFGATPVDLDTFRLLAPQIARALARIHARGVVHGELTPDNVVFDPDREAATIVDFDRAAPRARMAEIPAPAPHEASLPYCAPELLAARGGAGDHRPPDDRPVDHRIDLYALGATLYRLLTGLVPPLPEPGRPRAAPLPPSAWSSAVPSALDAIFASLLSENPDDRYAAADRLADDLERAAAPAVVTTPAPAPSLRVARPRGPHRRARERHRLATALVRARARERAACVLAGPPGSGKTALAELAARDVAEGGGAYFFARCRREATPTAGSEPDPLLSAASAAARAILRAPEEDRAIIRSRVRGALGERAPWLAALVPGLKDLFGESAPAREKAARTPEGDLCLALADLLTALAPAGPTALIVDDLDSADAQTLKLFKGLALAPAARRWLVAVTLTAAPTQGEGLRPRVDETLEALRSADPSMMWIELGGPSADATTALAASDLGADGVEGGEPPPAIKAELENRLRAERRARWLGDATAFLFEPASVGGVARRLARSYLPDLADTCAVDLLDDDGDLRRGAAADVDPARADLLAELSHHEDGWRAPRFFLPPGELDAHASRTAAEIESAPERAAMAGRHVEILRALGVAAVLALPLRSASGAVGRVYLARRREAAPFTLEDRTIAAELASRAGLALARARHHDDLRQAIGLRDEFLSIAAHELSTPLTSLKLGMEGIRTGTIPATPDNLTRAFRIAERQVSRLSQLTSALLDASRVRAGTLELDIEPVDLAEVVREAVERLEAEGRQAGSEIRVCSPERIVGDWDRTRLDQVCTNLLSNAIKFGRGLPIDVILEDCGDRARILVRDRGIGIAEDKVQAIFGRFVRGVSSRHYGGLGLGLYIVGQIIDALGGALDVTSGPGRGSTFTVDLPRRAGAEPAAGRGGGGDGETSAGAE